LTRIHADLRKGVEQILQKEKGWTREETAQTLTDVAGKLDANLERMISSQQDVQEK
jgi:hypothetical protein